MVNPANSNVSTPLTVGAEDILSQNGSSGVTLRQLTALQRAGMQLALGVGALGVVVIVALVVYWTSQVPPPPALPAPPTEAADIPQFISITQTLLDNHKASSDQAVNSATQIFEEVVVKVLLPLFTLILGYIFGARTETANDGGTSTSGA